jgi:hypothetical protein
MVQLLHFQPTIIPSPPAPPAPPPPAAAAAAPEGARNSIHPLSLLLQLHFLRLPPQDPQVKKGANRRDIQSSQLTGNAFDTTNSSEQARRETDEREEKEERQGERGWMKKQRSWRMDKITEEPEDG